MEGQEFTADSRGTIFLLPRGCGKQLRTWAVHPHIVPSTLRTQCVPLLLFDAGGGDGSQCLQHARQALYQPSHTSRDYSSLFRVPIVSPYCPLMKLNDTRQVECWAWCWCKVTEGITFLSLLLRQEGRMAARPAANPAPTLRFRSMSFSSVRQRPHPFCPPSFTC